MVQSLNTKVDFSIKATSMRGLTTYGDIMVGDKAFEFYNIMVGDKAFEFYNERNLRDFVQIPWQEVDRVEASVLFNKKIARFVIFTKDKNHFTFSTRDNKKTLRAVNQYIPGDRLLRSLSFFDVIKSGANSLVGHKK